MPTTRPSLEPGTRVRVTQQTTVGEKTVTCAVAGSVVAHEREATGSWFAHEQGGRLRLDRLRLRKDDGETTTLVLDGRSRVTMLAAE